MSQALNGKIAVVTGASRGLGRGAALGLAQRGAKVALLSRSREGLEETQNLISKAGGTAVAFPTDIGDPAAVEAVAQQVKSRLGPASILVNAAGIFGPITLIKDSDPQLWLEALSVNLIGPYLSCRAFVGGMIEQRWGRIVNFTSAASLHPPGALNSAYATSKVALNQFTRHLAAEIAGSGVVANVIHPGDVKTDMWADIRKKADSMGPEGEAYRKWVKWVEKTGGDHPQKAVDLVLRLSDEKAGGTNGQFLWIEGGLQDPIPSWETPTDARPWKD